MTKLETITETRRLVDSLCDADEAAKNYLVQRVRKLITIEHIINSVRRADALEVLL